MKVLESAPSRYDLGIRLLTLGHVDRAYDRLVLRVRAGQRVLDVGCGTGALTVRAARRGAQVVGIDVNPQMLDIARQRVEALGESMDVDLCEMGVAELDGEPAAGYDVVVSGLCFSELSEGERTFALCQAHRLLKPGGLLLLADEVVPQGVLRRLLHWTVRLPLAALTYLLTQTTTRSLKGLPGEVERAGFGLDSVHLNGLGDFIELTAFKPVVA
jgi:demethylmenaquinone methyltransferase/2-methoxy-6-polyprenyl-1,4-benzoquinol methylase